MSRRKPKDDIEEIKRILDRGEWNREIFKELYGSSRCLKCGTFSVRPSEVLDQYKGVIVACTNCPELNDHH